MDQLSRDLFLGFIKVHVLYHAAQEEVYGLGLIEELGRHGYRLGPGTLYPILHRMEKTGYLKSRRETVAGKVRRFYRLTPAGRRALARAETQARELAGEILEEKK